MNDLIVKYNGALVTTQNKISKLTNNNEISIQKLIRTYKADLEEFGILEFENQLIINSKNVKNYKKIYYLNEQQATLLLTYMKNSESVRNAKKVLVFAFYKMKEKLKNLEAEQMQKLAFRQSLGYKSQLAQQKEHYENKIKALQYDLEHKNELSFKRKLSNEELLELRKILAKDYGMLCFKEWEFEFLAEKIALESSRMTTWDAVVKKLKQSLDYWQNYDEYEEKWKKILRR
ncbi:Rha family transcriptional regulator [Campylobacter jejuni]